MGWCWACTAEGSRASHGPSSSGGGPEVDFVCLEPASAAIDDDSDNMSVFETNCPPSANHLCSSTLSVSALPWPVTGHGW